jgi:DoxX-like family
MTSSSSASSPQVPISRNRVRGGHVVAGLVAFAMTASALFKFSGSENIIKNFEHLHLAPYRLAIGGLELLIAVLVGVPKTSSVGTLLATGYFGGAVVAHLTSGDPGGIGPALALGALAWLAGYLRNPNLFESFSR